MFFGLTCIYFARCAYFGKNGHKFKWLGQRCAGTCCQGLQVSTQDRLEFIELSSDVHYFLSCILQVRSRVKHIVTCPILEKKFGACMCSSTFVLLEIDSDKSVDTITCSSIRHSDWTRLHILIDLSYTSILHRRGWPGGSQYRELTLAAPFNFDIWQLELKRVGSKDGGFRLREPNAGCSLRKMRLRRLRISSFTSLSCPIVHSQSNFLIQMFL